MILKSNWLNMGEICQINGRLADLGYSIRLDTSKGADYLMNLLDSWDMVEFEKIQRFYNLLD